MDRREKQKPFPWGLSAAARWAVEGLGDGPGDNLDS